MDYKKVKDTINKLATTKDLNQIKATEIIESKFKRSEIGANSNVKHLFRYFITTFIKDIPKKDLEETFKKVNTIYHNLGYKDSTLDTIISKDIRTKFDKSSEEHKLSKKLVKISYEAKGELIKEQKKVLVLKHSERIRFSGSDTLTLIRRLISSSDKSDLLIGLMLACGARPVELLTKSRFEEIENQTENQNMVVIKQFELAKKRGELNTFSIKPLLVLSFKEFNDALKKMRDEFESEKEELVDRRGELKQKFLSQPNKIMKDLFKHADDVSLYSCRGMYVLLSYYLYGKSGLHGKDPSLQLWANKCLGHKENDLNTQNHYSRFELTENLQPIEDVKKDVVELKERVGAVEDIVEGEDFPKPQVETSKRTKINAFNALVEKEYLKNKKVTQSGLETGPLKGVVPRSVIRAWFNERKLKELNDAVKN